MGELVVTEFVTLDGVAQAPGGPDEDREGGFAFGGWQAPLYDAVAGAAMFEEASHLEALLLGRRTYEIFAGYWPTAPEDEPFTGLLNDADKHVASRTLTGPLAWRGSELIEGGLAEAVQGLKERYARVQVIGSLELVQSLLAHGLVDRLDLWVYPLLLGTGKRVFAEGTVPAALRLAGSTTYDSGTVHLVYEVGDAPATGDMTQG